MPGSQPTPTTSSAATSPPPSAPPSGLDQAGHLERDKVDLDALTAELLVVLDQTIQPTVAWLWLRPSSEQLQRTGT